MRRSLPAAALCLLAAAAGCSRSGLDGVCAHADRVTTGDEAVSVAAIDADRIFWFRTGAAPALRSASRCADSVGPATTITTEAAFRTLAAAAGRLFFVDASQAVRAVPRDGGAATVLAAGLAPLSLWARARELLVMTPTGFFALPADAEGVAPAPLGPDGFAALGTPLNFRADDSALYWLAATADGRGATLYRMGRSDGSVTRLVEPSAGSAAPSGSGLLLDGAQLFFGSVGGDVMTVPTRGGAPTTRATGENPGALCASANLVWWRNAAGLDGAELRHLPRGGGATAKSAGALSSPSEPVADLDGVWVDDGRDLVRVGE